MSPTVVRTLRIDEDQWAALQRIEDRDGVPVVEQVRRGIRLWLERKLNEDAVSLARAASRAGRGAVTRRKPKSS